MINSAELAAMQATQRRAMPEVAEILRETSIEDNRGGLTLSYVSVATGVEARIGTPNQQERASIGDRYRNETVFLGTFPSGTPIGPGDRAVIGGNAYDVLGVNEAESFDTATRAVMRRADDD